MDDKKIPEPIIGSTHYSQALSDLATKHIENMILIMQEQWRKRTKDLRYINPKKGSQVLREQWCKYLETKDLDPPKS